MVGRSGHTWARLAGLTLLVAGCNTQVGSLGIRLTRSWDPSQEPLQGVASKISVRIDGPDGTVGPRTFSLKDGRGVLDISLGSGRRVTVDGLGPEKDVAVCRGRSAPLNIGEGDQSLSLFVGLVGKEGAFSFTPGKLAQPRAYHTATLLADGSILIAGGVTAPWRPECSGPTCLPQPSALRTAEVLDGSSLGVVRADPSCTDLRDCMISARIGHTATLLGSGNVLIAGGSSGGQLVQSLEVYLPEERTFFKGPHLSQARTDHAAAPTERGVALVGGVDAAGKLIYSSEAYDQGTPKAFPGLVQPRRAFSLTRLADGALLVIGGYDENNVPLASTEILGAGSPAWAFGPELDVCLAHHSATLLHDGTVLVAGGLACNKQRPTPTDPPECLPCEATATEKLVRYNPATGQFLSLAEPLGVARWGHSATQLADNRLFIVGGFRATREGEPVDTAEAIQFFGGDLTNVNVTAIARGPDLARAGHTATLIGSDWLLIIGGVTGPASSLKILDTAVAFVY